MTNHDNEIVRLVQNGKTTANDIADALSLHDGHVRHILLDLLEDGTLTRERNGRSYVYAVANGATIEAEPTPDSDTSDDGDDTDEFEEVVMQPIAQTQLADDSVIPVTRDYDWAELIDTSTEFVPTNGEWDSLTARIDHRHTVDRPVHALVRGDTGCGKTTLAQALSNHYGWPMITIQATPDMDTSDLVGFVTYVGDETRWQDGPLTKALLASRDGPVILLVDEVNRAPSRVKASLFAAFDHRAQVTLTQRGNERIRGVPLDIILIATMNEGAEYTGIERIDLAEKGRYSSSYEVTYLGMNDVSKEADLVADRTGVPTGLAALMVETANDVRRRAKDDESNIRVGVPTRALIEWAANARAQELSGIPNPVIRAAEETVVSLYFGGDTLTENEVMTIIKSRLDHADVMAFDADTVGEAASDTFVCEDCYSEWGIQELKDKGHFEAMDCPDCFGVVVPGEPY